MQNGVFRLKLHFSQRKSATEFLCVKTVNHKVVRHSLCYISMQEWFTGDVPFYVKICPKLTHPLKR